MAEYILGIDMGTTSMKAAVYDTKGNQMKSAVVEYRNGVESWREDVISRNAQGRPTLVKSKGEASAAISSYPRAARMHVSVPVPQHRSSSVRTSPDAPANTCS